MYDRLLAIFIWFSIFDLWSLWERAIRSSRRKCRSGTRRSTRAWSDRSGTTRLSMWEWSFIFGIWSLIFVVWPDHVPILKTAWLIFDLWSLRTNPRTGVRCRRWTWRRNRTASSRTARRSTAKPPRPRYGSSGFGSSGYGSYVYGSKTECLITLLWSWNIL